MWNYVELCGADSDSTWIKEGHSISGASVARESIFRQQGMECKFLRQHMSWHPPPLVPPTTSPWRHSPRACYLLTMQVDRHHLSFRHCCGITLDQSCLIRLCSRPWVSLPKHIPTPFNPSSPNNRRRRCHFREDRHLSRTNQLMTKEQLSGLKFNLKPDILRL